MLSHLPINPNLTVDVIYQCYGSSYIILINNVYAHLYWTFILLAFEISVVSNLLAIYNIRSSKCM
jgi:hypothetical protein